MPGQGDLATVRERLKRSPHPRSDSAVWPAPPVASEWLQAGGLRLHARHVGGAGTTVVCVHGVGVSSRYMAPIMCALAGDFDVYALDLPGFGLSDKPPGVLDVAGLADALVGWMRAAGTGPAVVLANSFGCQIAVDCAVRWPKSVEALVLVGPTTDPSARSPGAQIQRWLRNGSAENAAQIPLILRDYQDAGGALVLRTFAHSLRDRIEDKLPQVEAPALVVRGRRDRIVPQAWAEELVRLLPRGRLVAVPGGAHTLNFTHPVELAERIRAFLGQDLG